MLNNTSRDAASLPATQQIPYRDAALLPATQHTFPRCSTSPRDAALLLNAASALYQDGNQLQEGDELSLKKSTV